MLIAKPGVFAAGEMLDWEAPTGGYLLQACFSTAVAAAEGILQFVNISGKPLLMSSYILNSFKQK